MTSRQQLEEIFAKHSTDEQTEVLAYKTAFKCLINDGGSEAALAFALVAHDIQDAIDSQAASYGRQ